MLFKAGNVSESPHRADFKLDCSVCHSPKGWMIDYEIYSFNHDITEMPLKGAHRETECRMCHASLVFSEAQTECISCHDDVHYQTAGNTCDRCHTTDSWLVNSITEIHQQSRFPLLGPHLMADCYDCHSSASFLKFEPLGIECVDCHLKDFQATTDPNHVVSGYSTNCIDCHMLYANQWSGAGFNHDFFPLTKGHSGSECANCHKEGTYVGLSSDCVYCHQSDYNAATNPNHVNSNFSSNCTQCHTTDPGWKPAQFKQHDFQYFPIYSGEHQGEWNSCYDCHTNTSDYSIFSCIDCHEHRKSKMDEEHDDESDYSYNSIACLDCHPDGRADDKK